MYYFSEQFGYAQPSKPWEHSQHREFCETGYQTINNEIVYGAEFIEALAFLQGALIRQ